VSQSVNIKEQQWAACANNQNRIWNDAMESVAITTVQQTEDCALFHRNNRWIDSRILQKDEHAEPDRVVDFGTDAYFQLARSLADQGRAAIIAVRGELFLVIDGQRVLIKAPVEPAPPPASPTPDAQRQPLDK